eukprot:Clim_evm23s149 gene=Clim_evmTU23s149
MASLTRPILPEELGESATDSSGGFDVLLQRDVATMADLIEQVGWLSLHAADIFAGVSSRVSRLNARLNRSQNRLENCNRALESLKTTPGNIRNTEGLTKVMFLRQDLEDILSEETRPLYLRQQFRKAEADELFVAESLNESLKGTEYEPNYYSDPDFFRRSWQPRISRDGVPGVPARKPKPQPRTGDSGARPSPPKRAPVVDHELTSADSEDKMTERAVAVTKREQNDVNTGGQNFFSARQGDSDEEERGSLGDVQEIQQQISLGQKQQTLSMETETETSPNRKRSSSIVVAEPVDVKDLSPVSPVQEEDLQQAREKLKAAIAARKQAKLELAQQSNAQSPIKSESLAPAEGDILPLPPMPAPVPPPMPAATAAAPVGDKPKPKPQQSVAAVRNTDLLAEIRNFQSFRRSVWTPQQSDDPSIYATAGAKRGRSGSAIEQITSPRQTTRTNALRREASDGPQDLFTALKQRFASIRLDDEEIEDNEVWI